MKKTYVLTGVSKGLGLIIAKQILNEGNCLIGISSSISNELVKLKEDFPNSFKHILYNLLDTDGIKKILFQNEIKLVNQIDGFINNAAFAYDDLITNINYNKLENMYRVNVFSPMIMVKYILRNMLFNKTKGSLVHISSISAHTGYKGLAMYASTKGALEAFSKNCAREWGSLGIRSNCIVAGFMETSMSESLDQKQKNRIYNRTSLKQAVNPSVVANTVRFLLGNDSTSITGQNIFIDSGTI